MDSFSFEKPDHTFSQRSSCQGLIFGLLPFHHLLILFQLASTIATMRHLHLFTIIIAVHAANAFTPRRYVKFGATKFGPRAAAGRSSSTAPQDNYKTTLLRFKGAGQQNSDEDCSGLNYKNGNEDDLEVMDGRRFGHDDQDLVLEQKELVGDPVAYKNPTLRLMCRYGPKPVEDFVAAIGDLFLLTIYAETYHGENFCCAPTLLQP